MKAVQNPNHLILVNLIPIVSQIVTKPVQAPHIVLYARVGSRPTKTHLRKTLKEDTLPVAQSIMAKKISGGNQVQMHTRKCQSQQEDIPNRKARNSGLGHKLCGSAIAALGASDKNQPVGREDPRDIP